MDQAAKRNDPFNGAFTGLLALVAVLAPFGPAPSARDMVAVAATAKPNPQLKPGTSLGALRASMRSSRALAAIYAETIDIPAARSVAGIHGRVPAMIVFDDKARHERMVIFRRTGNALVIRHVVDDARVSYSYRDVFIDAKYARQFAELDRLGARHVGPGHRVHTEADKTITVDWSRVPEADTTGAADLVVGGVRFRVRLGQVAGIDAFHPRTLFVSRDQTRLAYTVLRGNGLPTPNLFRLERAAGGEAAGYRLVGDDSPAALGL